MAEEKKTAAPHGVIMENRHKLHLSGVTDVGAFDEQTVHTVTSMGGLLVRGRDLHISQLNLENGELRIEGEIHALQYTEAVQKGKSKVARLFR